MTDTKKKIIRAAEELFFEFGIANVRLQQIADKVGISVGNLAYHYKNKEIIVESVYQQVLKELSEVLSSYLVYPDLSDFDKQFSDLYRFLHDNAFCVNNLWEIERTYPHLKEDWTRLVNKLQIQIRQRILYHAQRGVIRQESYRGEHELLTQAIYLTINFWTSQQLLRGNPIEERMFKKALWALIYPHLSPEGKLEYAYRIEPFLI